MLIFDRSAVAERLPWGPLIEALRQGFRRGCELPDRHHHTVRRPGEPDATLLLMPAWQVDGLLGVKLATVVPGNAGRRLGAVQATYVLLSAVTGEALAVLDGLELTLRRTAAASALAASYLVPLEVDSLLVVGTGNLAPHLARAHCSVRPYTEIMVWGRSPEKAAVVASALLAEGLPARPVVDLGEAARHADTVSCATLSEEPLVYGEWLRPGSHLDLVGGFTERMRECDDEAVRRAELFVDTRAGALAEAGDLLQPMRRGVIDESAVLADLFELARSQHPGRTRPDAVTLFKSVGTALEDLTAASLIYRAAAGDD